MKHRFTEVCLCTKNPDPGDPKRPDPDPDPQHWVFLSESMNYQSLTLSTENCQILRRMTVCRSCSTVWKPISLGLGWVTEYLLPMLNYSDLSYQSQVAFSRASMLLMRSIYMVYQKSCHLGFCLLSKLPNIVKSSCVKHTICQWSGLLSMCLIWTCFYSFE